MDIEELVMKDTTPLILKKRRGYALASVVALMFLMTVLLGAAIGCLEYSSEVMESYSSRFKARNALESMTNLSLRWLSAEVRDGARPRASTGEELFTAESLIVFASNDVDGCTVKVYDLEYDAQNIAASAKVSWVFPPLRPGGYMIRATAQRNNLAPLTMESVYVVTTNAISGERSIEILDEKPVYSRELFRK